MGVGAGVALCCSVGHAEEVLAIMWEISESSPALLPFSMKSKALHLIMAWKMSNVRESAALTRLYFRFSQCLGLRLSPTYV